MCKQAQPSVRQCVKVLLHRFGDAQQCGCCVTKRIRKENKPVAAVISGAQNTYIDELFATPHAALHTVQWQQHNLQYTDAEIRDIRELNHLFLQCCMLITDANMYLAQHYHGNDTVALAYMRQFPVSQYKGHAGNCWPTVCTADSSLYPPCSEPCPRVAAVVAELHAITQLQVDKLSAQRIHYIDYSQRLQQASAAVPRAHNYMLHAIELNRHKVRLHNTQAVGYTHHVVQCLCCMAAPVQCVLRPCMHAQLCQHCVDKLRSSTGQVRCPTCSADSTAEKIYL